MPLLHLYHYARINESFCAVYASQATISTAFPPSSPFQVASRSKGIRSIVNGFDDEVVVSKDHDEVTTRYPPANWIEVLDHLQDNDQFTLVSVSNDPGRKAKLYLFSCSSS